MYQAVGVFSMYQAVVTSSSYQAYPQI